MSPALAREWHRHTSAERLLRFGLWLGVVAACVWALRSIEIIPEFLADAPEQMLDLLARMWPPDWSRLREIFRIGFPIGLMLMAEVGLFSVAAADRALRAI